MRRALAVALSLIAVAIAISAFADDSASQPSISFSRDIAPVLAKQCQTCHGPDKSKGKYRLDTFARLTKIGAGDDQPIVPGKPEQSGIYKRLIAHDEDDRMPQKADPLPVVQIAIIRRWIEQGARFDGPDPAAPISSLLSDAKQPDPPQVYARPVPIAALAFSPDGKLLATSGYHEVLIWNAADGRLVNRISNIPKQVLSLTYAPDGKHLAVAGGTPGSQGELRLIELGAEPPATQLLEPVAHDASGDAALSPPPVLRGRVRVGAGSASDAPSTQPPPQPSPGVPGAGEKTPQASSRILERISDVMTVVRFSPDGTMLAAGGADNAIRIYDVGTAKRRLLIEQHADWITDLAFNADGSKIVSASRDKSSRIFDTKTGAMIGAYVDSEEPLYAVAWSDDGKRVFSSSRDHKIHIWNTTDAKKAGEISLQEADAFRLLTVPGQIIACLSNGDVTAYSQKDRNVVRTFGHLPDWAYSLAIDPTNNLLAAGCHDGSVRVWKTDTGAAVLDFRAMPATAGNPKPESLKSR
ncbi:MAG TPA: c-type cytochrome domain-containing protein [Humisphaera sp.]|nr:c-type cytochrome domain-containing protein [Humisphaera sp.]